MSRLRIAVVSPFVDKKHGSERPVAEFLARLGNDYEFHLYSARVEDLDTARITWHRVPSLRGPHLLQYLWWFAANHVERWWDGHVRGLAPDLVYSPGINCLDADVITVHAIFTRMRERLSDELRLAGNSVSNWPRTIHRRLYYRLISTLEQRVYRRPAVFLAAVSGKVAKDLENCLQRAQNVTVIFHGIDLEQFSPQRRASLREASRAALGLSPTDFSILLIGNDWKGKGLPCLIEAVREAGEPSLRLLVVGSDQPAKFAAGIENAGLTNRLQFLPIRPDVEFYYAAADAYVGPSLEDTFALPVAECMACGLPVIASRNAGVAQLITPGCDGFVLDDPADSAALASMIRRLISDPDSCRRMGEAAARTASQYSWERNAQQMRDLFERTWQAKSKR